MSSNPQVVLLIEVLQRVFRWWGLPLAGVLLGLAAAVALFVKLPKTYEARTLIFVSPSMISEEFVRSTVPDDMALRLRSLNEAVLSRPYLSRILAEVFRVDAEHPDYEPSLRRLRSRVTATINQYNAETGAGSFELTYRDSDADLTAKVVNALAALYIEENTALRTRQAGATAETLRGLAEDVSRQLQTQEAILSEFRARHLYELESHLPANLALLKSRQDEMMVNTRLIEDAELKLESLQRSKRLEANGGELASPSAAAEMPPDVRRANELRQELAAARVNYTEQHPRVQQLIRELAQVEQRLKSLEAHSSDPGEQASSETISPIDLEIRQQKLIVQRLKEQSVTIRADIAEFQRRIDATPRVSQELAELSKGLDVLRDRYRSYQSDFEEARGSLRIEEERKGSQFEIVERASIPTVPVSPKPLQLLVLGIAGGPMALIGPLVAFFVLRQRVHSAAGIALLTDVPVLAVVPELPTRRRAIRTTIRHVINAALTSAAGVTLAMAVSRFGVEGLLP